MLRNYVIIHSFDFVTLADLCNAAYITWKHSTAGKQLLLWIVLITSTSGLLTEK